MLDIAQDYPHLPIILNDKDAWISAFWQTIAGDDSLVFEELLSKVAHSPTIDLFNQLANSPPQSSLEQAYRAIFFNRTCFNGIVKRRNNKVISNPIGGREQKSKYKVNCRFNSAKLQDKMRHARQLLMGRTHVYNLDVMDLLPQVPLDYCLYLDPPYIVKAHMLYHEHMAMSEHRELCTLLKNRDNWLLSYDDDISVHQMYEGCQIVDLATRYCINGKKTNWKNINELLISRV